MEEALKEVAYLDEYPHLKQRVELRRIGQLALFDENHTEATLYLFEVPDDIA